MAKAGNLAVPGGSPDLLDRDRGLPGSGWGSASLKGWGKKKLLGEERKVEEEGEGYLKPSLAG